MFIDRFWMEIDGKKIHIYLYTMYIYCVYPAMSKNPKQCQIAWK